jgi:hypothetical protein
LPLALLIAGCTSASQRREAFLQQHAQENFQQFRGLSLFIRGSDHQSNTVLVLADSRLDSLCPNMTPLTFIAVKTADHSIQSITNNFDAVCSRQLSTEQIHRLVVAFLSYKVHNLMVDGYGNVYVGFDAHQVISTDLVYVRTREKLDKFFQEDFVPKQGAWYERKQLN